MTPDQEIPFQKPADLSRNVLLRTKLTMPLPRTCLVARPRLTVRIDREAAGNVTLVSAPAGFGKTTLITAWAAGGSGRCAWLALDEGDNEPERFWRYVVAALRTVEYGLGEAGIAYLAAQPAPAWESLVTLLLNDVSSLADPITLVLDDYHLIHAAAIHHSLSFLLHHQPTQLHVVILTRADPPLALARLRVQERLCELRAADLRFTPTEMEVFFDCTLAQKLSTTALKTLSTRIEGWAAGLQLAALSLRGLPPADVEPFVAAFSGAQQYVLSYLLEEVLQRQPPHVQTFLLHTSVLRTLHPALCTAVTGAADARQILARLAQENLFIFPLDEHGQWYRYHRLFAGALRSRLQETEPELVPDLRRRATTWYAAQGIREDAPGHLLPPHRPPLHSNDTEADLPLLDPLTEREWEILLLIGQGLSNQQIADRLVISVGTVKGHVNHLLNKLNAQSRTEAVARAQRLGLLKS